VNLLQGYMIGMKQNHKRKRLPYGSTNFPGRKADRLIKYCTSCKLCWEHKNSKVVKGFHLKNFEWYENFPTYGKERKICPNCTQ